MKPYYVNEENDPVWMYTSFSRAGSIQMAKTLQKKLGAQPLEQPIERDDGMWVLIFTNPFMSGLALPEGS